MARAFPLSGLLFLAAGLICPAASVAAGDGGRYIVEFHRFSDARPAISQAGGKTVLELPNHGVVAALLSDRARSDLREDGRVLSIEPDPPRFMMAQTVPYGIPMVQADLVSDAGAANRKVCIIDSGYYTPHEDLQGAGVSGEDDGAGPWDQDGSGHGTHVAGTISALNNSTGVVGILGSGAIRLHIVRVFGDSGTWTYASDLVAALDQCRSAGAHIVNMSLGGSRKNSVERKAFAAAEEAGTLLVAAAGNGGSTSTSYPAGYPSVVSVAAVDSNRTVAGFSQQNRDVELAAPGVAVMSTVPWHDSIAVAVGATTYDGSRMEGAAETSGTTGALADGGLCDGAGPWAGKVVLCQRGSITFAAKIDNVVAGGGVAAVVYNNVPGGFSGTLGGDKPIPAIAIRQEDGDALKVEGLGQSATVVNQRTKPASGYEAWDGTSMATPHVTGVAALVWSHFSHMTNHQIRDALTGAALDLGPAGRDPAYGYGLVQAKAAYDRLAASGW